MCSPFSVIFDAIDMTSVIIITIIIIHVEMEKTAMNYRAFVVQIR